MRLPLGGKGGSAGERWAEVAGRRWRRARHSMTCRVPIPLIHSSSFTFYSYSYQRSAPHTSRRVARCMYTRGILVRPPPPTSPVHPLIRWRELRLFVRPLWADCVHIFDNVDASGSDRQSFQERFSGRTDFKISARMCVHTRETVFDIIISIRM